jgi:hypothetical protein
MESRVAEGVRKDLLNRYGTGPVCIASMLFSMQDIEATVAKLRSETEATVLGPGAVQAQKHESRPARPKKSYAPLFHAFSRRLRRELYDAYHLFFAAFHRPAGGDAPRRDPQAASRGAQVLRRGEDRGARSAGRQADLRVDPPLRRAESGCRSAAATTRPPWSRQQADSWKKAERPTMFILARCYRRPRLDDR